NTEFHFIKAYSEFPGKAIFVFNGRADTLKFNWLSDVNKLNIHSINYSAMNDSIYIWYKNLESDSIALKFSNDESKDTIVIRLFKQAAESSKKTKSKFIISPENATGAS